MKKGWADESAHPCDVTQCSNEPDAFDRYCTVRVKEEVCDRLPEVAVMVTVDDPAGVEVLGGVMDLLPPPHPENACMAPNVNRIMPNERSHAALRFRLIKLGQKSSASRAPEPARPIFVILPECINPRSAALRLSDATEEATPVAMVRVVVTAFPLGVILAGLKLQVEFAGNPEQVKVVAALKPLSGVTVTVVVVVAPLVMLALDEDRESVKLGIGAVTTTVTAPEIDGALLASPA